MLKNLKEEWLDKIMPRRIQDMIEDGTVIDLTDVNFQEVMGIKQQLVPIKYSTNSFGSVNGVVYLNFEDEKLYAIYGNPRLIQEIGFVA